MATPRKPQKPAADRGDRLQKVLAAAGLGSRRSCEELIVDGRVEVDGQVVSELGTRVDPARSEIRVDGDVLKRTKTVYYAVHKPAGVVCTNNDPQRRLRVIDLVPGGETLFTVGRLDRSSEGLILVTNDGDLANRIAHPRYGVTKTYQVRVAGSPTQTDLAAVTDGIYLADGFVKAESVKVKKRMTSTTDLVIVLKEGRNREVRRILAKIGFKVLKLKRTRVGSLSLSDLPEGAYRTLSRDEVRQLKYSSKEAPKKRRSKSRRTKVAEPQTEPVPRKRRPAGLPKESSQGTVLGFEGSNSKTTGRSTSRSKPKGKPRRARKGRS